MIKLKTKSGRVSKMQKYAMVSGALLTFGPQFYQAAGLSAETAIVVVGVIVAIDKAITMALRTITSEGM